MRSRFTAFATGHVAHLVRTWDPEAPQARADLGAWRAELAAWCDAVTFERLEVQHAAAEGDHGTVTFRATLRRGAEDLSFTETSRFVRRDGRWLYVDGVVAEG